MKRILRDALGRFAWTRNCTLVDPLSNTVGDAASSGILDVPSAKPANTGRCGKTENPFFRRKAADGFSAPTLFKLSGKPSFPVIAKADFPPRPKVHLAENPSGHAFYRLGFVPEAVRSSRATQNSILALLAAFAP